MGNGLGTFSRDVAARSCFQAQVRRQMAALWTVTIKVHRVEMKVVSRQETTVVRS